MKIIASGIVVAVLLALGIQAAHAQGIVGYNKVTVPANSDVLVSVPFTQNATGTFAVSTKTASGVTVTATLSSGLYANAYYVRFTSGTGAGLWTTISANGTGSIDFADTSVLASVSVGDKFSIYPHATLGLLFPAGMEGISFKKSTSQFTHQSEVLTPDTVNTGINKAASAIYYFYNNAWRLSGGSASADYSSTTLPPQAYFIIRNRSNPATALTFFCQGNVSQDAAARAVPTASVKNDIAIVSNRPVKLKLSELGLGGTAAFVTSPSQFTHNDELYIFDNTATGMNKSASAIYYYYNGGWRKSGQSATINCDSDLVDAGAAMIIRKNSGTPGTATWTEVAPY